MQGEMAPDTTVESALDLHAWRTRALNTLLVVATAAATPLVALVISEATHHPWQWPAALAFLVVYLLWVGLAIFRGLDYRLRAWGLLLLGYAAAVLVFARGGLAGDGRVYLLALPVLALILIGARSGLIMTALSLLTFAAFAETAHLGWMAGWLVRQENTLLLADWLNGGVAFALALVVLVFLQWRFSQLQAAVAADNARLLKAARTSQALYQTISELTSDFAYAVRIEPDGTLAREWLVGAFTDITGFTLDEVDARGGWSSFIHPDDLPAVRQRLQALLSGQQGVSEFRAVTKSGEVRWLREHTRPVWNEMEG